MAASFIIITPTTQNANAAFAVSGQIIGYAAAPVLNYADDSGAFAPLPANNAVTATTFTFTNPGLPVGSHTITVRDANNTATAVATGAFSVVAASTPIVRPAVPSLPAPGVAFTFSGTLANYATVPALTYSDNSGVAAALPSGFAVTTTSFSFLHPGLAAGGYTTVISDGSNAGSIAYNVTAIPGGPSLDPTIITPGVGFAIDNTSNRWTITTGGQVAVNGVVDAITSNVTQVAWITPLIWQENSSNLWWSKTSPSATWLPVAGTPTSPLASLPTITINAISSPTPNSTFPVTGSLANYSVAPTLTYADNSGPASALPTGSVVTTTSFSFTHPTMPAGSDALVVSDGTFSAQTSYTVVTPGWTSLSPTTSVAAQVSNLLSSTAYDFEVYATNSAGQGPPSAILTVTTAPPPVIIPGAPTGLSSTAVAQTTVSLSWTAPTTGTAPFTYQPQSSLHGANTWTNGPSVSVTSGQITGLTAGTSYDFQVAAINSAGTGAESAIFTVSTAAAPPPTVTWNPSGAAAPLVFSNGNLTATSTGSAGLSTQSQTCLSTTSINSASGIRQFEVTMTTLTNDWACGIALSTVQMAGIGLGNNTNGDSVAYYPVYGNDVYCAGVLLTSIGFAPANGDVATVVFDPSVPQIWVSSANMRAQGFTYNNSATANPATLTGGINLSGKLAAGNYFAAFYEGESGGVGIFNGGSSAFSYPMPSNVTTWAGGSITIVVPGVVTGLAAGSPSNTSIPLTWTAPATGSSPFTYNVQQSLHLAGTYTSVGSPSTTSFTVTGLSPSTSYDFRVSASNSAGTGGFSSVVTVSTIATSNVPGAPSALSSGTATATTVPLTWSAPTSGSAPTGYQVQYKLASASTYINFSPTVTAGSGSATVFSNTFQSLATVTALGGAGAPATVVLNDSGGSITDASGGVWTSVAGVVYLNGVAAGFTANVIEIAYVSGVMWSENASNQWYFWTGPSTWTAGNNPVGSPSWMCGLGFGGTANRTLSANNEAEYYWLIGESYNAYSIATGGGLVITADKAAAGSPGTSSSGSFIANPFSLKYNSGAISSCILTNGSPAPGIYSTWLTGYVEFVGLLPAGRGLWPAYWAEPVPDGDGEIDFMEALGHDLTHIYCTIHYSATDSVQIQALSANAVTNSTRSVTVTLSDYSKNVHSYGVDKQSDFITWYVDRVAVAKIVAPAVTKRNYYIMANLAVGDTGSWPGLPDSTTQFPAKMTTNSVSAWPSFASAISGPISETVTGLTSGSSYDFQVYAFNASGNGPASSPPVVVSTVSSGTGQFSVVNGQLISPTGTAFIAKGINISDSDMSSASTNAANQPLTTRFPGINFVRVACFDLTRAASFYQTFVTNMTAAKIAVKFEDHTSSDGSNRGGGVGVVYTGTLLTNELAWYTRLATAFKGNPYVWFGTTNEPAYSPSIAALSTWHGQIVNAIRGAGANNIIAICLPAGGNPGTYGTGNGMTSSVYAPMTNVIWDFHQYAWAYSSGGNNGQSGPGAIPVATLQSLEQTNIVLAQTIHSADGVMPVIAAETGPSTTGSTLDVSGFNLLNATHANTTGAIGRFCGFGAWHWASIDNFNNLTPDEAGSSLTSPYGTTVASYIAS